MVSLRAASFLAGAILFFGSSSAIAAKPTTPSSPSQIRSNAQLSLIAQTNQTPSRLLTRRIQRDLASRLNVTPSQLQVIEATRMTWPDQCLGLARPNERCRGGEVSGWKVVLASSQQMWTYRSNQSGRQLALEPLPNDDPTLSNLNGFSAEVSQQLLETVSQQVQQPIERLSVLEVQSAVWDGCLGIFEPDRACTRIAILGFRTIVSDGETTWIYHLSGDGSQIAQNTTASGAARQVSTLFTPYESPRTNLDSSILFQSQLSGDFAGSVNTVALSTDGTLYREQSGLNQPSTRTVIRQLSSSEMSAFQNYLLQQQFPNLDRMRYLTQAAFADYPTVQLSMQGGLSTEYIDLEMESLPTSLKNIIAAWEVIVQPKAE